MPKKEFDNKIKKGKRQHQAREQKEINRRGKKAIKKYILRFEREK